MSNKYVIGEKYKKGPRRPLILGISGSVTVLVLLTGFATGLFKEQVLAIAYGSGDKTASSSSPSSASEQEHAHGLPVRLKILKIKVDTKIEYMGLTKTGNMDVPANIVDVGWYKYGTRPGNIGSAVIGGHLDGPQGQPGVFNDLNKLQKGDRVSIVDNKQHITSFVVREIRTYGQNEQPREVFHSSNGVHLNLITCTGSWDKIRHSFSERLVVFTDKAAA